MDSAFDMAALVARLEETADAQYRDFSLSTIPGVGQPALGVRVPRLRALAREITRGDWRGFLEASRRYPLFEARMLHAIVLGSAKCPVEERIALIDAFLPEIDNWAVCDTLCSSFKPAERDRQALFEYLLECAGSDIEYRKRFGLVMLMSRFHDAPWAEGTLSAYRAFSHPGYYARMGAVWGLATLFLYRPGDVVDILKSGTLDDFTHNKAIQKARESYRVSDADKAMLLALKRQRKGGTNP